MKTLKEGIFYRFDKKIIFLLSFIQILYAFFSNQMKLTAEDTVYISKSSECRNIRFLEHVQVRVNLEVWPRGDLLLTLESPSKTFSRLTQ